MSYEDTPRLRELKELIEIGNENVAEFGHKHAARLDALEEEIKHIAIKAGRPMLAGGGPMANDAETKTLRGAITALLSGDQAKANTLFSECKAMSAGTDPSGGYLVHTQFSDTMTKVMAERSPFYRLARKVQLDSGDTFEEPVDKDSAEATWVGETTARTDTTTPELANFRVELNEITAMPKATQKLVDIASIDVLAWLTEKVGDAFAVTEGTAYHTGDGIIKPKGILTYTTAATADATRTWGQLEHIATGASGAFPTSSVSVNPADVLVDVVGALKAQYRANARWLMNKLTAARVRKLKDADGRHVWLDSLVASQPATLLGYPVEIDESMPDVSAGSLSIAFGDFAKGYTIVERPGTKFLTDPYTDKPNVRLYAYRRVGGAINDFNAIKLMKFS